MILREKLPFPSGTATAQLVSMLHDVPLERKVETARSAPVHADDSDPTMRAARDAALSDATHEADRRAIQDGTAWRLLLSSLALSAGVTVRCASANDTHARSPRSLCLCCTRCQCSMSLRRSSGSLSRGGDGGSRRHSATSARA